MADTGLINIDVSKTLDISSANAITIQSNTEFVKVASGNNASSNASISLAANGIIDVRSTNTVSIVAPVVTMTGNSLVLVSDTGNNYVANTFTNIETRLTTLEANVYSPNTANLQALTTVNYVQTAVNGVYANVGNLYTRVGILESNVYNVSTGLLATWNLANDLSNYLTGNVAALNTRIDNIGVVANNANRTYVQSNTIPITSPKAGDLWFNTSENYRLYRYDGSAWIDIKDQTATTGALTAVNTESIARIANDEVLSARIDSVLSVANNALAAISTETSARIANGEAQALQITNLQANVETNSSRITSETLTRTSEVAALGSRIDTIITTTSGAPKTYVQSTQPTNPSSGDLWFVSSDNYRLRRWNTVDWEYVDDRRVSGVVAALTSEIAARTANDVATTSRLDGALSRIGASEASITTLANTTATQFSSIASQISQIVATQASDARSVTYIQASAPTGGTDGDLWFDSDDGNKLYRYNETSNTWVNVTDNRVTTALASISSEVTARTANDASMTTSINNAISRISNAEAWITTVQNTTAANQAAIANSVTTISTKFNAGRSYYQASPPNNTAVLVVGDLWFDSDDSNRAYRWNGGAWIRTDDTRIAQSQADISTLASSVSTINSAVASLDTRLSARIASNEATISNINNATANSIGSFSQSISSLSSSVGSATAQVSSLSSTVATLNNGVADLRASAQLVVDGGRVSGFRATADSQVSEFIIQADRFKVQSASGSGLQTPFSVENGITYIDNAVIRNGSISSDKITTGAISNVWTATLTDRLEAYNSTQNIIYLDIYVDQPCQLFGIGSIGQSFTDGERAWGIDLFIEGYRVYGIGGKAKIDSVTVSGSRYIDSPRNVRVQINRLSNRSAAVDRTLTVMALKR